jgi:protein TIF31
LVSTFSGFLNRSVSQPRPAYSSDETNGSVLIAETSEAQPVEQPTNGEQVEGQQEEESTGGLFQISVKLPHEPYKIQVMVGDDIETLDHE